MTPIDMQDRAQYLSLALFAQSVVSALMEYADENRSTSLKPALSEALESLIHARRPSASARHSVAAFTSYEHLRTLDEVWRPRDRAKAIQMIRLILKRPRDRKAKLVANKLIDLFSKLQNQALWNFEQPKPVSPRVMQRLCQMA